MTAQTDYDELRYELDALLLQHHRLLLPGDHWASDVLCVSALVRVRKLRAELQAELDEFHATYQP